LEEALLSTGFPYNVQENPLHCVDLFTNVISKGYPVRRLGSAAIDLCYIAAGRFAAFWEVGLKPWDVAAGKLMLEEAGGRFSDWEGKLRPLMSDGPVLASNGLLHEKMLSLLRGGL
jgi:myo-inositol-1(or 4)-monophosphatase